MRPTPASETSFLVVGRRYHPLMFQWLKAAVQRMARRTTSALRPGEWGERLAGRELKRAGLRMVGHRVRVGRRDEIDLIAWDGDTLVFVEVKTRATESFGRPVDAVNRAKRRHLSRAAVRYIAAKRIRPAYLRFDVVEVVGAEGGPPPIVRHLRSVFGLEGGYRLPW
jgi:putative endonuclease